MEQVTRYWKAQGINPLDQLELPAFDDAINTAIYLQVAAEEFTISNK